MSKDRSLTISGDLGSGKSTVATKISERLGLRKVSLGDMHRDIANSLELSELQINRHPQRSAEVDVRVDNYQCELAQSDETLIVDSRLGWHFFAGAFKVQLQSDPVIAARRVFGRAASKTESYASLEETLDGLRERSETERARFIKTYGADKTRLENYDLICDTTSATPDEVADVIISVYCSGEASGSPVLFLDPGRIRSADTAEPGPPGLAGVRVAYIDSRFVLVTGQAALDGAQRRGDPLIRASLVSAPG
jgi:predicted cytidylate kinase